MKRLALIVSGGVVGVFLLAVAASWIVLQSGMFSQLRKNIISDLLTEQIGQPFVVEGDVRVQLNMRSRIIFEQARIPSENMPGVNLVRLAHGAFSLDVDELWRGKIELHNITVSDLEVTLLTDAGDLTSWTKMEENWLSDDEADTDGTLFGFLYDKRVNFSDVRLNWENHTSGFEFLFNLSSFLLDYRGLNEPVLLSSHGTLNGQLFDVTGTFPRTSDFDLSAKFGDQTISVDGRAFHDRVADGFEAELEMTSPSMSGLLALLGLYEVFDGTARLTTNITHVPGSIELGDTMLTAVTDYGTSIEIAGKFANVLKLDGLDMDIDLVLDPEDAEISPATGLSDFILLRIKANAASENGNFDLRKIEAFTNSFETDFNRLGPAKVGRVYRTEEGLLELTGIEIQSGDIDDPFFVATGQVLDLLDLSKLAFEGTLKGHADMVFEDLDPEAVEAFGEVTAEFRFSDASGEIALERFSARSAGSELWQLSGDLEVRDVTNMTDMDLSLEVAVADGSTLLRALDLTPIDTGPMRVTLESTGSGTDLVADLALALGGSELSVAVTHRETAHKNVVRGALESPEIDLDRLLKLGRAVVDILQRREDDRDAVDLRDDPRVPLPLVLPPDGREVLPLVIDESEDDRLIRRFLRRLDIDFEVHIAALTGSKNFSGLDSRIVMNRGQLVAGPVEARADGARFRVDAKANLMLEPDVIRFSGDMAGWRFNRLVTILGLDMDATGTVNGRFDLAMRPLDEGKLINKLTGWARLDMRNGKIASTLIDLAGLGVFPWLFSNELQKGYSNITCLVAPFNIRKGLFSSNNIVLETKSVQMVVRGNVDLRRDRIAIRAEPRPIDRPLARSAWPIEVTGKLSEPEMSLVKSAASRERRGKITRIVNRQPCRVYDLP